MSDIVRILLLLVLFGAVTFAAFRALTGVQKARDTRAALRAVQGGTVTAAGPRVLTGQDGGAMARIVEAIEARGLSLGDSKPDALRDRLAAAGFPSAVAPRVFTLVRLTVVVFLPLLVVGAMVLLGDNPSVVELYFVGTFFAALGLLLPAVYLRMRTDARQTEIVNGFPAALDLMLVCVEAGLGLEAALDRVGRELAQSQPLVSSLLIEAVLQLRAGASREEALRRMADTARSDEISSFSTLLIQSDKLGTSIGTTLRVYASEMREKRRMRAEERAHRLPVLISIPLICCMLPTMVGVLMIPAMIRVIRQLLPAMAGGG